MPSPGAAGAGRRAGFGVDGSVGDGRGDRGLLGRAGHARPPARRDWADTATLLAADLLAGNQDPRRDSAGLLGRAIAALPAPARGGRIWLRADAGYVAGQLARAALLADLDQPVEFAIYSRVRV